MANYRTSKVDEAFYSVLTVFDFDLVSTVSGQLPGDFTVRFAKNDTPVAVSYAISEIGSTGDYVITISGGFPSVGLWVITTEVAYNGSTWRDEVEVRVHDIDDVYDVVVAGGSGVETVVIQVEDTTNGNVRIPDALLNVYDAAGSVFITFGRTDASGERTFSLDPGTYIVRVFKPGVSCDDYTLVVIDTSPTPTTQTFLIECASVIVAPPASPVLCRLYADFQSMAGEPWEGFKLHVHNLFDPASSSGLAVIEPVKEYLTDAAGHVEFDVVRGARIRVAFVTTPLSREFVVPDKPVESLLTVFGAATDAFQIVKK